MAALRDALEILGQGQNLTGPVCQAAIREILAGEAAEPQVAAFLTALRVKGETALELAAAVRAVRERMIPLDLEGSRPFPLLDTCGTGGDGASTANVSTAAAIVVAAMGVPVAKHGNRAASGRCGSSEVLSELGVAIEAEPEQLRRCLVEKGITFLYAPKFHPTLRALAPLRRLLPYRTLFNLIGPLANPARPDRQLIGAAGDKTADLMARALLELGIDRAAVVTGSDGLDEVTLSGPTFVRWVDRDAIRQETWQPEDFGLPRRQIRDLRIENPADGADRLRRLLEGEKGAVRDVVLANASAALLVIERVESLAEGVILAGRAIDSGAARALLDDWAAISSGLR